MISATLAIVLLNQQGMAHDHGDGHVHSHAPTRPARQVTNNERYRPTPMPDRISLSWAADPATTAAITWRTDGQGGTPMVEYAVADEGPKFLARVQKLPAESQVITTDANTATCHTVRLSGLQPDTRYMYRVGDGTNWSEWIHFSTAAAGPRDFSFVYFGDAQNDVRSLWSRVAREAYREAPKAAFFLHAGDLINKANADGEWGEWFEAAGFISGMTPVIATPGNHEYANGQISGHWQPQFEFPKNGPPGLSESTYFIDYQGTRIISLNSNEQLAEQARWLRAVLAANPNRWTIVTFHHPVYSTAKGRDNPKVRETWQPIFDEFRVDLVLQGHDHTYGRTNLASGTGGRSPAGTVYVVSVSGPKMYEADRKTVFTRIAEETQLFQIIHVSQNEIRYEARTATGRLYDAFLLRKSRSGPNQLRNLIPNTPERTRTPAGSS